MPLSQSKLDSAVKYNKPAASRVGWKFDFGVVAAVLGNTVSRMSESDFAKAIAAWQAPKQNGLTEDGKLGPGTWRKMEKAAPGAVAVPIPTWLQTPNASPVERWNNGGTGPRWMQVARAEQRFWNAAIKNMTEEQAKVAEFHMNRDEEYFLTTPYFGGKVKARGTLPKNDDRRHWCAAFVNYCLHRAGYSHTGSAGAHSFTKRSLWHFDGLEEPEKGCVIVLSNGTRGGHVAFLDDVTGTPDSIKLDSQRRMKISGYSIKMLGGNQGQRVNSQIDTTYSYLLTGYGRNGVRSPYMKPLQGPGNCNVDVPTHAPHFCGHPYKD